MMFNLLLTPQEKDVLAAVIQEARIPVGHIEPMGEVIKKFNAAKPLTGEQVAEVLNAMDYEPPKLVSAK